MTWQAPEYWCIRSVAILFANACRSLTDSLKFSVHMGLLLSLLLVDLHKCNMYICLCICMHVNVATSNWNWNHTVMNKWNYVLIWVLTAKCICIHTYICTDNLLTVRCIHSCYIFHICMYDIYIYVCIYIYMFLTFWPLLS